MNERISTSKEKIPEMKPTTLALIGLKPAMRPPVLEALRSDFPEANVIEVASLADFADSTNSPDLVVLAEPDDATAASAALAVDASGAPRWAVVILGRGEGDLAETVPPEEWQARGLARIFQSALLQHTLVRENLRMRGDLKTVARRISHDLRTPAGCIHTSSDLLDELAMGKSAAIANIADIFRQSSTEISQIVDRVSFVIRASADPIEPSPVDMGAVVASVLRQLEPEIRAAGEAVIQPDTWPQVEGVETWLSMIWGNLIRNALQHGGPPSQVRIGWNRHGEGNRFFVEDRGPGVGASRVGQLFSPFDQLHAVRSAGLGLSIVERLVSLQGGTVGYEKSPEGGARFWFTLP